ncbi:MAG TPA: nucleotide exchange factor GrpE [Acidimicrobiales bacterium]|nr:nucleotide exchange factor GrpE [Acidimicrobiales bacterium]
MSGQEERPRDRVQPAGSEPNGDPVTGAPAQPAGRAHGGWVDPLADAGLAEEMAADAAAAAATPEIEANIEADEAAVEMEEDLDLAGMARERDEYLDALRRLQADFENYKKRMIRQQTEHLERAAASLVEKLLPVFDTADLAIAHGGGEEVKQIWTALFETLEREGLERIDPLNAPFDPTVHDAVAHEAGDGPGEPQVVEVMRAGYRWKGRVLRPAMVKVRG